MVNVPNKLTPIKEFRDAANNLLKIGDLISHTSYNGSTKIAYSRIVGFTAQKIMVKEFDPAQPDINKWKVYRKNGMFVSLIYRNAELSQFPDEWLAEFVNSDHTGYNWDELDPTKNKSINS